jgi:hypothetical protein
MYATQYTTNANDIEITVTSLYTNNHKLARQHVTATPASKESAIVSVPFLYLLYQEGMYDSKTSFTKTW